MSASLVSLAAARYHAACDAARRADLEFSAILKRHHGAAAGDARYNNKGRYPDEAAAAARFQAACQEMHTALIAYRQAGAEAA